MKALLSLVLLMMFYVLPAKAVNNFDITFNFGPSISQTGNIQDLGDPNFNTGMGFNYFFRPNHGAGFTFNSEYDFDGGNKFRSLNDGSITTFDFHYAYRFMKGRFHFLFEPGIGWQTLYDRSQDYYWGYWYMDDVSTAFIMDYKLLARFIVSEWGAGDMTSSGSFFVGGGLIQTFSFSDSLGGEDISGSRMALLFQVGLGW